MTQLEADVVIVGAGPCGLMLAIELGRRGVRVEVLDREAGVATAPQANATQARTMEYYRRLGFADEIRALGLPPGYPTDVAYFTTYTGYELARFAQPPSRDAARRIRELDAQWNGAELPHRVPQSCVEAKLLEKAVAMPGVHVRFGCHVTGFEQAQDGVTVIAENSGIGDAGIDCTVRAAYLVGADGPRSVIREQLGIRYGGAGSGNRDFMGGQMLSVYLDAPGFYDVVTATPAWMYWCFNRRRRALLAATDGAGRFVLLTQLQPDEQDKPFSDDEAAELFFQALGTRIPVQVQGTATWFAGRGLVAERYGAGRVFLGGDAAHLFTPTGGMGYNTAVEDAVNLGWKLAAVLAGQAGPQLLTTYETERRPVALRNTRFALQFADSVGLYRPSPAIEDAGEAGDAARARAAAYLGRHGAEEFTIPGFTFGARYDDSAIIWHDDSLPPPDAPSVYVPTAKPGGRPPHLWMPDDSSLFDHFGFGWTVMHLGGADGMSSQLTREAQERGLLVTTLDYSGQGNLCARLYDLYEAPLVLIRPDHVVAWRGAEVDPAALLDRVVAKALPAC